MLKVPNPLDDEAHGAEIMKIFAGHGAVRVLESDQHIYLLERVGTEGEPTLLDLVYRGDDDQATTIICDVIERLHAASKTKGIPAFASSFTQHSNDMVQNAMRGPLAATHGAAFQFAFDVSEELAVEFAGTRLFLHGDIHHFNVLPSNRGWLAIDPKGIAGPRIYEYANALVNPYMHEAVTRSSRMKRQAAIMAERGLVDEQALLRFTFVHAMQCAAWSHSEKDQHYWLSCAKIAANLARLTVASL